MQIKAKPPSPIEVQTEAQPTAQPTAQTEMQPIAQTNSYAEPLPDLQAVCALVRDTAQRHYAHQGELARRVKCDGSWVTDIDQCTQDDLLGQLRHHWPQYGFVGEEMPHDAQLRECAQSEEGYWVLDPLDGTTNFVCGFSFYGVSLALVVGGCAQLGVVYDPVRDECFTAQRGCGAQLNQRRLTCPPPRALSECIAIVDYKRLVGDLAAQLVRSPPYRSQRNLGASTLEWCWLAAGRAHLYLHGAQKLWDYVAGHLILCEAGGAATTLSGKPLDSKGLRQRSVVAAVNAQLLTRWDEWLRVHSKGARASPL